MTWRVECPERSRGAHYIIKIMYFVYIIRNDFGKLYTGITKNPIERLNSHNSKQGSEFTKGKAKFGIVFTEEYDSLSGARKREIQIKKWSRDKKEFLIEKFSKGLSTYEKQKTV